MDTAAARSISVFFPCHNEEASLPPLAEQAVALLREICPDFQLIIVDDGSSDGTAEIAAELAERFPEVEVCTHPKNRGYGAALKTGFAAANRELVFYTDGDAQFDISELTRLLPLIDSYDIVSAYRLNRRDNFLRKLNAAIYQAALFLLFGLRIRDVDCAFKLYRRRIFEQISFRSQGAVIDAEILLQARKRGFSIHQIGVKHYPRRAGSPSGGSPEVIWRAVAELLRLRWRL